jgi:hypothetical protein
MVQAIFTNGSGDRVMAIQSIQVVEKNSVCISKEANHSGMNITSGVVEMSQPRVRLVLF